MLPCHLMPEKCTFSDCYSSSLRASIMARNRYLICSCNMVNLVQDLNLLWSLSPSSLFFARVWLRFSSSSKCLRRKDSCRFFFSVKESINSACQNEEMRNFVDSQNVDYSVTVFCGVRCSHLLELNIHPFYKIILIGMILERIVNTHRMSAFCQYLLSYCNCTPNLACHNYPWRKNESNFLKFKKSSDLMFWISLTHIPQNMHT